MTIKKKVLFSATMMLLFFMAAELGLRLAFPKLAWSSARWLTSDNREFVVDENEWPPTYPKNTLAVHSYIEFEVETKFNSDGFRDDEFSEDQGPVVIFLGDSTTMGHGIQYDRSFAVQTEAFLKERYGDLEVWNLGRSGSGPVIQARLLERILNKYPRLEVEAVVMCSAVSPQCGAGNDLVDMIPNLPYLETGRPQKQDRFSVTGLIRKSAVLHGMEVMLAKWRRENMKMPRIENFDKVWEDYVSCVEHIQNLSEARGASLAVAYVGTRASEDEKDIEELTERFQLFTEPRGIAFIRCVPKLDPNTNRQLWFYPIDGHINSVAHDYCAAELALGISELMDGGTRMARRPIKQLPNGDTILR